MSDAVLLLRMPVVTANVRTGQLSRIFLDPESRSVSHLVVMPDDESDTARLVPVHL